MKRFVTLESMKYAQHTILWIIAMAIMAAALVLVFAFKERKVEVELQDLRFSDGSPMLILQQYRQRDETGTLLLNLQSGEEQFFPGEWEAFISPTQTVYLKGQWPRTSDRAQAEEGLQLYEVRNGRQLTRLQVNEFIGEMEWIQENREQTYVLIAVRRGDRISYCMQAREQVVNDVPVCDYFQAPEGTLAVWNPHAEHEAVFRSPAGELFVMDPFEGVIKGVSPINEAERFEQLNSLFMQEGIRHEDAFMDEKHQLRVGSRGLELHEHMKGGRWQYARLFQDQSLNETDLSWRHISGQRWYCAINKEFIQSNTGCAE